MLSMTYYASEKVMPRYHVMAICQGGAGSHHALSGQRPRPAGHPRQRHQRRPHQDPGRSRRARLPHHVALFGNRPRRCGARFLRTTSATLRFGFPRSWGSAVTGEVVHVDARLQHPRPDADGRRSGEVVGPAQPGWIRRRPAYNRDAASAALTRSKAIKGATPAAPSSVKVHPGAGHQPGHATEIEDGNTSDAGQPSAARRAERHARQASQPQMPWARSRRDSRPWARPARPRPARGHPAAGSGR